MAGIGDLLGAGAAAGGGGRSGGGVGGGVATGGRVAPRPPSSSGGIGGGVSQAARKASPGPSKAAGVGGGLLTAATLQNQNPKFAFKLTGDYAKAIAQVFAHQSPEVKAAIIGHAVKLPWLPESKITLNQLRDSTDQELLKIAKAGGTSLPGDKNDPAQFVAHVRAGLLPIPDQHGAAGAALQGVTGGNQKYQQAYAKAQLAGVTDPNAKMSRTAATGGIIPANVDPASIQGGVGAPTSYKFAKNFASDVIHLPENTVQGLYGLGSELVQGHVGNAFHMLIDPYVHAFMHPTEAFSSHPLNTVLLAAGPKFAAGKAAGDVARTGRLGAKAKAFASTERAPLVSPTGAVLEARSYSPNLMRKGGQVRRENRQQAKGIDPNVARPAPGWVPEPIRRGFNVGLAAKEQRISHEIAGVAQMQGREARSQALHTLEQAKPPSPEAQGIIAHVLQNIVRTKEGAKSDIMKEILRLQDVAPSLKGAERTWNMKQQESLRAALNKPEAIHEAFRAVEGDPAGVISHAISPGRAQNVRGLRDWFNARDRMLVERNLLHPDQALRAKLFPYAQAHMGAKYSRSKGELVAHNDAPLPTAAIVSHLKANGLREPAYVGHYPGKGSAKDFFSGYHLSRGNKSNAVRKGEMFRTGGYNHTWEGLRGQAAKAESALGKSGLHDALAHRLGVTMPMMSQLMGGRMPFPVHPSGRFNLREARVAAHEWITDEHNRPIPGREPLVPFVERPSKQAYSLPRLDEAGHFEASPAGLHDVAGVEFHSIKEGLDQTKMGKDRNIILLPESAAQAMLAHAQRSGELGRGIGQVTQKFRGTVLPYSIHWMTQILTEAMLRGGVNGALTPFNHQAGRALWQRLEKTPEGRKALQEMVNATFWHQHEAFSRHNPDPGMLTQAWWQAPTHFISDAHNRYSQWIGKNMSHMETSFRKMGMGKLAREQVREWNNSWRKDVKLQGQNLEHLAQRLEADPALVAKFGRSIDMTFGKYNKFSPLTRSAIQTLAPFLPWYINAAKFVLYHLPHNHPVAQSLTTSLAQWAQNEQQQGHQLPLDKFRAAELARLSPWGLLVTHDPFEPLLSPFLPEVSGGYNILRGLNKFGTGTLTAPGGKPSEGQRVSPFLGQLLESFVPLARDVKVGLEGGQSAYGTSTLWNPQPKPGTKGSVGDVANKILNPFHTLQPGGPAPGGKAKHTNVLGAGRRLQDTSLLLHPDRVGPDGRLIKRPPKAKGATRGALRGWGGSTGGTGSTGLKGWGDTPPAPSSGGLKGWG